MRVAVGIALVVACGTIAVLALGSEASPRPAFTRMPSVRTASRAALFAYRVALPRPRFRCRLDGRRWTACGATYRVTRLRGGRHRFCVRARSGGRRSGTACFRWLIVARRPEARTFTMAAKGSGALLPGGDAVPVDIAFTNPGAVPITILAVRIAVVDGGPARCSRFVRAVRGLAARPVIPGGATRSLSQLGVARRRWPQLAMRDDGTNQDACRNAPLRLVLTGTARG